VGELPRSGSLLSEYPEEGNVALGFVYRDHFVNDVVTSKKVTNLPVGCQRAISVTRRLAHSADLARVPEMDAEFHSAVDACQIPAACPEAFKQATKLFSEVQKNRPDALAIYRAFQVPPAGVGKPAGTQPAR
jgi:hypothetical protein